MKRILSILLFFLVFSDLMYAQTIYEVTSSKNLNVRSAPNSQAGVLGVLKPGERIQVISTSNGWAEFMFLNKYGYSSLNYLQVVKENNLRQDIDKDLIIKVVYEVISKSSLNVRSRPSTQSTIIGSLTPGFRIEDGEEIDGWLKFKYNGEVAYSSLKYFRREEIIEQIVQEVEDEESVVINEPVFEEDREEIVVHKKKSLPKFMSYDSLFDKQCFSSDLIDVFLTGHLGLGLTSYTWEGGDVNGKLGMSIDAVGQIYWKDFANLYMDVSVGYAYKGAAKLPLHYLNVGLTPLGYYYDYKDFRFVGDGGLYLGIPLSSLKYVENPKFDFGLSLGITAEYNLFSLGVEFNYGFINIAVPYVHLHNWGLMAKLGCKILSFN